MSWNHRYILRVATNLALCIFALFALGGTLWMVDEFLDWNILPDWIDRYVQAIVLMVGAAAGLAIATSLLCSVVVVAEAAAERANIREVSASPAVRRWIGWAVAAGLVGLFVFHRVDVYRKELAQGAQMTRHRASYEVMLKELREALSSSLQLFPAELWAGLTTGTVNTNELVTFLSALQSSTAHHPEVRLLLRASPPYRYLTLRLRPRRDDNGPRFELERQYYTSFPSESERQVVNELLSGGLPPLDARLQGEVLNNISPSAWGLVTQSNQVSAVLIFRTEFPDRYGLFHAGPGGSGNVLPASAL